MHNDNTAHQLTGVPPPSRVPPSAPPVHRAAFHGRGGTLFGMQIVNILLSILTLGMYHFWGKAKVRRYLYGQIELLGDRFAYHGTGKELFVGFLKMVVLVALFVGGIVLAARYDSRAVFLIYPIIALVTPVALYGAMRYTLSRTSWKNLRFSFRGGLRECMTTYITGFLLTALTLGLYYPYFRTKTRRYWVTNSYFGTAPFEYDGEGKDLFGGFIKTLLLTIPTLYLSWVWFAARVQRYDWGHTRLAGARFESDMTGGGLFRLMVGNLLLLVCTIGLAFPWVMVRNLTFVFNHLTLHGSLDSAIKRGAPSRGSTAGEGLAEAMDVGLAIG